MEIIFTKTSHERHTLCIVRDDGTREEAGDLESRSYLRHDLMHYVVEKAAGLHESFYGSLASGKSFVDMRAADRIDAIDKAVPLAGEGGLTELVVATLQGANKEEFDAEELLQKVPAYMRAQGFEPPAYFTRDFIDSCIKEFRYLLRRYDSLKTGESLALAF